MKKILVAILLVTMMVLSITACKSSEEYTVTFDSNGGSAVASQTVNEGEAATKPADPIREGYTFAGWYFGEATYDFGSAVTEDITLKAKWNENTSATETFTVSFNTDGGSAVASATVESGAKVQKPQDPTKDGFTFDGWYVGDEKYVFTAPVTEDIEIVAKWTAKTYKVTFCAGSLTNKVLVLEGIEYGQLIPANDIPTNVVVGGYTFTGKWYTSPTEQTEEKLFDFSTAITANKTIYAGLVEKQEPVSSLAGTWSGTEFLDYGYGVTENNEYTFVIDGAGNVTATCVKNGVVANIVVTGAKFNGSTLTINFTLDGSSKSYAFAYDNATNTLTKGEFTLSKQ